MKKQLTKILLISFAIMLPGFQILTAQNAFWEEDFSSTGLPTGWATVDTTGGAGIWDWCSSPAQAQSCIFNWGTYDTQPEGGFPSTTAENGFVFMDSDLLGTVFPNHVVRMTTTTIDCSGQSEVWAKFESVIGVYELTTNNNAVLRVSTNGTDWTNFNIFELTPPTDRWSDNPEYSFIDISSVAANQPSVYLQFSWTGNYEYWWLLDDIQLYDSDPTALFIVAHDMRVNKNFYAISPNAMWPASQVECFGFLADVENIGTQNQTNVNLNITIEEDGTAVFTENLAFGNIPADSLMENQPVPGCFTPNAVVGTTYTGTYEISADSVDLAPENNIQTFDFIITDTVFAKEFGATTSIQPADANWEGAQEPHSWAFGNYFYIVNGEDYHAFSATFGIAPPEPEIIDRLLTVYLYKWDEDTNEDGDMDPGERTRVAFNIYEITGDEELTDLITLPLLQFPTGNSGPIDLDSDQPYVLMVEYATIDEVNFAMAGALVDYGAMTYRSELNGVPEGNGRYGYMLGVNGDLESEPYSNAGFTTATTPVVRLNIGMIVNVDETLDAANIIQISPNPADNKIKLNIDLIEMYSNVNVRILDVNGQVILNQVYENLQHETLEFDVSKYASGAYFLHLVTEEGARTERFIIQH